MIECFGDVDTMIDKGQILLQNPVEFDAKNDDITSSYEKKREKNADSTCWRISAMPNDMDEIETNRIRRVSKQEYNQK